jgi:hypothetical protein
MAGAAPFAEILPPEAHDALPPISAPVLLGSDGRGWIPHAHRPGMYVEREVAIGIGLAWTPVAEAGRVLLCLAGGNPRNPSDEALTVLVSRQGLREMIADLRSIDDQLGDMR